MPAINAPLTKLRPAVARHPKLTECLALVFLTVAAAALRLAMPGSFPPGLHGDEAWIGLEAQRIVEEGWIGIWTPTAWGQPAGPLYWVAAAFNFFPDSVSVLRGSLALLGIVTVPVFYLFARTYFGIRPALIGTALLAFSHWHIHYSRTAYPLISAPLFECAALLLLGIGLKKQKIVWLIAAGAVAGAGVYTYRSYLLFTAVVMAAWVVMALWRPYSLRRFAINTVAFGLPAIALSVPMLVFILTNYEDYTAYGNIVSLHGTGELGKAADEGRIVLFLGQQALRAVGTLYAGGWVDHSDGMGGVSLLSPVAMALFTAGMGVALFKWRDWRYFLLIAGVVAGLGAVAMTVEWGQNRRGIIGLPMVFAAAGLGADVLWKFLAQARLPRVTYRHRMAALPAVFTAALIAAAAWNISTYFKDETSHPTMRSAYAYDLSIAAEYLAAMEGKPYVYFYSDRWSWNYEARRFNAPGLEGEDRSDRFGEFSLPSTHSGEVLYLLMPSYKEHLAEIMEMYPGGKEVEVMDGDREVFTGYWLKSVTARTPGSAAAQ